MLLSIRDESPRSCSNTMRLDCCSLIILFYGFASTLVSPSWAKEMDHGKRQSRFDRSFSLPLHQAPSPHLRESNSSNLPKRSSHNLLIQGASIHSLTIPVFQAAAALSVFYDGIVRECASNWADIPPLPNLCITNHFFVLTLNGVGRTIPWSLVAEIAANMLSVTRMGFTGTYDLRYFNPDYVNGMGASAQRTGVLLYGVLVQFRMGTGIGGMNHMFIDASSNGGS